MLFTILTPLCLALHAVAQDQKPVLPTPIPAALQVTTCPSGAACNTQHEIDPIYNLKPTTTVVWLTARVNKVDRPILLCLSLDILTVPSTLTETETTVSAAVTVIPKDAIGHCISYNPVPVPPPIVTYYVETTLTDYSLTTVTTTSTTHIQAEVTAPAGCVREIGKSPQPALPGNGDELCKGIMPPKPDPPVNPPVGKPVYPEDPDDSDYPDPGYGGFV